VVTTTLSGTVGQNNWYTSDVTVTLTATDAGSGVALVEYSLNGATWLVYSAPFTVTAEGTTTFQVRATDNAGATSSVTTGATVRIDRTAPVTTATFSGTVGQNNWYTSAVTITLAATDTGSGVALIEYRIGSVGVWTPYTGPFTVATPGTTTVYFRSKDGGALLEADKSVTFSIDTLPPTVSAAAACTQGGNGWCTSAATLTMTATDATSDIATRDYQIGAGAWTLYTAPVTVSAQGTTVVTFRATDTAGLSTQSTAQVGIDSTAPVTTAILAGTSGKNGWYTLAVTVTLAATDALSGISLTEYRIGAAGVWTRYTGPVTVATAGVTTVYFHTKDSAGSVEADKSITFSIDTTTPATTATLTGTVGDNGWYKSSVKVILATTDTGSGVAATYYKLDGGVQQTYTAAVTIATVGSHTLEYWTVDKAGNVETHKTVSVNIDLTAPTVASSVPAARVTSVPVTQTITLTMSENITAGTAYGSITLKRGNSSVALTKTITGAKLALKPTAILARNSSYTLTVPAGALKDLAGNPNAAYTLTFTSQK
jgi:hypothetical protein